VRRGAFAFPLFLFGAPAEVGSLGGCDSGQWSFDLPPGDAGAPDARNEAVCTQWATRFCAYQAQCPDYSVHWEVGQCVPRETLNCEIVASDPDVDFDAASVAACPEPDGGDCTAAGGDLCLGPGRAPVGAPCSSDLSCASGVCTAEANYEGQPLCGGCAERPCDGGCPAGQACQAAVDGGAGCFAVAPVGHSCKTARDCASFFCAPDGTCAGPASLGQPCSEGAADAAAPVCGDPSDFCDPSMGICRAIVYRNYGESCVSTDVAYQCAGLGSCDPVDDVCIPPVGDGYFCDETQGLDCVFPARCIDQQCAFPSPAACAAR
jgi:hypothetical protein